ncbi:MAG: PadR family transcriptional regulator [Ktedonobacteraceae bacterium]|nr:PadR family transcriptional regulator [Ktedonobacteraceae bacterium]
MTGYELKRLFAESATLAWSGNSNQVYTPLVELHREGLVSVEVQLQETRPSRKVYTITEKGLAELKTWVLSTSEAPLQKNAFLLRLAWADQLSDEEVGALLQTYEKQVQTHLLLFRGRDQRSDSPRRTPREAALWKLIAENWISFYERELRWIQKVREGLVHLKSEQEDAL